MITINTENIIKALLYNGFDKIDPILYVTVEAELVNSGKYRVEDNDYSSFFTKFIDYDGLFYKLKPGYNLDSNIITNGYFALSRALNDNPVLTNDISELDYEKILAKKISEIGTTKIGSYNKLFCDKEKEILCNMFNINSNNVDKAKELKLSR